jgi:YHS domain-containing protein
MPRRVLVSPRLKAICRRRLLSTTPAVPAPLRAFLAIVAVALVAGCGGAKNTIADGADQALMLRGNDPVAYFTVGKAVRGDPAIKADHDGVTYRFASDANRRAFLANPRRYEPQYAGFCASGAPYALKAAIGADTFAIVDDKLYLYGGPRSRQGWMLDYAENIRTGDMYWETETKDVPYRLQNLKRYAFKVPGYKTDDELDAIYAQRKAAGTLNPLATKYGL